MMLMMRDCCTAVVAVELVIEMGVKLGIKVAVKTIPRSMLQISVAVCCAS